MIGEHKTGTDLIGDTNPHRAFPLALLLTGSIVVMYWLVLKTPFVQDDWHMIRSFLWHSPSAVLHDILDPHRQLFYRPAGSLYAYGMFRVFGLNPMPYHIAAIALHCCTSLLVVASCFELTRDTFVSWATGFLYGLAALVHMEPLTWIVGVHDIFGALFFFLSLYLFLKDKTVLSVASFAIALASKEATLVLPLILFLYCLNRFAAMQHPSGPFRRSILAVLPHLAVLIAYAGVRVSTGFLDSMHQTQAYSMRSGDLPVLDNLVRYVNWGLSSVIASPEVVVSNTVVSIVCVLLILYFLTDIKQARQKLFLAAWFMIGLLPVIFFQQHAYRYYLTYSLPAFLLLCVLVIRDVLSLLVNRKAMILIVTLACCVSVCVSFVALQRLTGRGLDAPTLEGSNNLFRKGSIASMTQRFLKRELPALQHGSSLIFDWLPVNSFCGDAGLQSWYNDTTLHAFEMNQIRSDSSGLYAVPLFDPFKPADTLQQTANRNYIDAEKAIVVIYYDAEFRLSSLDRKMIGQ